MSEVVPQFFVQRKYESFTRQLNGWGFKRHQSGADFNAYYHECFLRGLPHLAVLLTRVKRGQGKQVPHVEGEPNFYEMDRSHPLPRPPLGPPTRGTTEGYGVAPGPPPEEYGCPAQYAPRPGDYPPPAPPYYAGPHGDPRAGGQMPGYPPPGYPAPGYPAPGYPPHLSYPTHYGPPQGYYSHPPGPVGPSGVPPTHFSGLHPAQGNVPTEWGSESAEHAYSDGGEQRR